MSSDRSTRAQPALWDEEVPHAHGQNAARQRPAQPTKTAPPHSPTSEPRPPTATRPAQPTHPELGAYLADPYSCAPRLFGRIALATVEPDDEFGKFVHFMTC
jgi:hypothetical protein